MKKLIMAIAFALPLCALAQPECGTINQISTANGIVTFLNSDSGRQYTLFARNSDSLSFFASAAENNAHVCVEGTVSTVDYNSHTYYSINNAERAMN